MHGQTVVANMKRSHPQLEKLDVKRKKVLFSSPNDPPLSPESPTEELSLPCENEHDSDAGPQDLNLATPTPSISLSPSRDESMEVEEKAQLEKEQQPSRAELVSRKLMPDLSEEEQVKNIIRSQFDLEILLKHRELRLIEDEMAKIEVMMIQLKQHSVDPKRPLPNEPANFVEAYAHYLKHPGDASKKPEFARDNNSVAANRPQRLSALRSQTRSIRTCTTRRSDGALVKLVCSGCNRSNFGGVQGFINHCRISHNLEFSSHEQAANICGVVIDEEEYAAAASANASAAAMTRSARAHSFGGLPTTATPSAPAPILQASPTSHSNAPLNKPSNVSAPSASLYSTPSNFPPTAPPSHRASEVSTPIPPQNPVEQSRVHHLASFLKTKDISLDIEGLMVRATEKLTKSYLIEGEEDFEPSDGELGNGATPIQRVMAEAKRLRINVDEIRKSASAPSSVDTKENNKKTNHNKEKAGNDSVASHVSGSTPPLAPLADDDTAKPRSRNSRRMPSGPCPLVTRRRASQLEMEKRGSESDNCAKEALETKSPNALCKKKDNNVIGNISKYIQLSRFF